MRTLLFDIDGTLLLTHHSGSGSLKHAIQDEFGLAESRVDIDFAGRTDRSIFIELLTKNDLEPSGENQRRLKLRYTRFLPTVLRTCGGKVLPGVTNLLNRLSTNCRFRCCVMTGNLEKTAKVKLEHFNLSNHCVSVYGGDHDQHRNDLAKRTAKRLRDEHGAEATRDMVVIGDTVADIRCGHAIGATVIAVATGNQSVDQLQAENPQTVLQDLSDTDLVMGLLGLEAAPNLPGRTTETTRNNLDS